MITVSVWTEKQTFDLEILKLLKLYKNIIIDNKCRNPDILILHKNERNLYIQTGILIMIDGELLDNIEANIAISCGLSDRNTITLSSAEIDKEMASLQREIISVNGIVHEPKEIDLSFINGTAEEKMMIAALKLVLDISCK